ncbi:MAG: hypothetical protein IT204_21330 [Fimbriimonadaceae bacterium]|nr:hypothetical protein [Fimbriimonadaceae bacterium]
MVVRGALAAPASAAGCAPFATFATATVGYELQHFGDRDNVPLVLPRS